MPGEKSHDGGEYFKFQSGATALFVEDGEKSQYIDFKFQSGATALRRISRIPCLSIL